jgi:DNA-binding CsgD family transcriptional regulator
MASCRDRPLLAELGVGSISRTMTLVSPPRGRSAELKGRRAELDVLNTLVAAVREGKGRALVVRGEPGAGKTALVDYLVARASDCRVIYAAGVQSEMELAFAALHQLCAPLLGRLEHLPAPQRDALRTAFGIGAGSAPDRFLVSLAVLSLFSVVAEEQPLICVVDDEQWLDRSSAQVLAFVARRLMAEPVGLVFSTRDPSDDVAALPELLVEGLAESDARALLDSAVAGPMDPAVRDRIVVEARGNPLALLELPRGLTPEELAGGFGLPNSAPLSKRIEGAFQRRLDGLPAESRLLSLVAAAEPVGEPVLVWSAADRLGIGREAAGPAADAGLLEFGRRVVFRHPLVRSVAYRSAALRERQMVHGALAEVTDPAIDPDRRAWHLAQAACGPDEEVAGELESSAGRALARGGFAAAAAFLEHAVILTADPGRRGQRFLAAAMAKREAGALDAALGLLVAVDAGPTDALQAARVQHLRGQIAQEQLRSGQAAELLLDAARRLELFDVESAREAYLEALVAAMWAGRLDGPAGLRATAEATRAAPPAHDPLRAVDTVVDALGVRFTYGYAAAAPALTQAVEQFRALGVDTNEVDRSSWIALSAAGGLVAPEVWDDESWQVMAADRVHFARETGALVQLQFALNLLAWVKMLCGELTDAASLIEEDRLIAEATGSSPMGYAELMLAVWRGGGAEASELINATLERVTALDLGQNVNFVTFASALLYNGVGRHDLARDAAWRAFEGDHVGAGPFVIPELAEAASRTGDDSLVKAALEWLSERTLVTPTEWALGIEARVRALLNDGETESCYIESIERLERTGFRAEVARSHLLYGEWLRRERRQRDARVQLRIAHEMLDTMGIAAFAERARRELAATGETARKRTVETSNDLTAQELQIAQLARDGLSNPEIGTRLFISSRTVQYHLRSIYTKLGISSRKQLHRVIPSDPATDLKA